MKILARSRWDSEQIQTKLECGASGVEIYIDDMNDAFFDMSTWSVDKIKNTYAIHMPVITERQGLRVKVNDYSIDNVNGWNTMPIVCENASTIARRAQHRVKVIARIHTSTNDLQQLGVYTSVIDILKKMSVLHPNIDICIENTARTVSQPLTNVDIIRDVNQKNIGSCLDVCNALMVTQQTRLLSTMGIKFMPYEAFFKRMLESIKFVHLSNAIDDGMGYGIGPGHDYQFDVEDEESLEKLERTMWLYKDHKYDCDVCITTGMDNIDYFFNTYEAFKTVCRRLNIPVQ